MYGAYGNEIPDTLYFRNSYEEMINAFKQMQSSYQGTLDSITRLQEQLNRYENSIDDRFSTIESNIPRLVTQAVDNAMNQYLTQLNNINNTINFIQQQVNDNALTENNHYTYITGELLSINGKFIDINNKINKINSDLVTAIEQTKSYTDQEINKITVELENKITEQLVLATEEVKYLILKNEITTKLYVDEKVSALHTLIESLESSSIAEDIKLVWQYGCCYGGLTAEQWYMMSWITCDDWNKSNITTAEWYTSSRRIFKWNYYINHMISPITGEYEPMQKVVLDMFTIIKEMKGKSLTASEYDEIMINAKQYDELNLSAFDYDWKGKDYVHKNN